ncbi:MAG TPA: NAD(P)-dependent oxidoreductase [Gemmatimonadaceae bacterium]
MTGADLEDLLSTPRPETEAALEACPGDIIILGAGGKMGPSLAHMAARAAGGNRKVIAVSRWSSEPLERSLNAAGVETIKADLLDRDAVAKLPDAPNVIFMAGQKFGTSNAPSATWATNAVIPANCAERYKDSRIVAFSTGNVYPLTPITSRGSREEDALFPNGEYAASCVGRERVFELFSERNGTKIAIVRLNYAIDLRYGVLVDIATHVRRSVALPVDMGYVNVIWQGDANRIALECLPHASSPPFVVNVTGGEHLAVRKIAAWFGRRWGTQPVLTGTERRDALLSDTSRMRTTFAAPEVSAEQMFEWVADWIEGGGQLLGKPTRFETRDGRY